MQATILVVDDEPAVADSIAGSLPDRYHVLVAYDAEGALERLDTGVDVVLLDRRMPGFSGDALLEVIRDRGIDCRVAIVSGVDPGLDVIGMGFDDYLTKPVTPSDLEETVDRLLRLSSYDAEIQTLHALAAKRAVLEDRLTRAELDRSPEYRDLCRRLDDARRRADTALDEADDLAELLTWPRDEPLV